MINFWSFTEEYKDLRTQFIELQNDRAASQKLALQFKDIVEEKLPELGCNFQGRCPRVLGEKCFKETPPWQISKNGNAIKCHIDINDLLKHQKSKI